jgi:dGTPase
MDWADDIAYSVHDLEDGILSGYLQPAIWGSDPFLRNVHSNVLRAPIKWQDGPPSEREVASYIKPLYDRYAKWAPDIPMDLIRETSRKYIDKFQRAGDVEVIEEGATSFDFRLNLPEEVRVENQVLKSITFEYILRDPRTLQIFHKGERIILKLFEELWTNATKRDRRDQFLLFPRGLRPQLAMERDNQSALARVVCDHIASMTEGQALRLYARLFAPFSASEGTPP